MKTALRMCFVQTLQVVKVNRCPESNEDSINSQPEGKTKFLFVQFCCPIASLKWREPFRKLRNSLEKRKRNDFNWNRRIRREYIQIRRRIIEAAFYVP